MWGRRKEASRLGHLVLAGGSVSQWAAFTEEQWQDRLEDLWQIARSARARFVTVHPHDLVEADPSHSVGHSKPSSSTGAHVGHRELQRAGIRVVVDPVVDGRERIRDVVRTWPARRRLTERRLGRALFGEAGEPDLVIVLGPNNRLPRSLVWELAYGELVFVDVSWNDVGVEHLHSTIEEYAGRQRRFGGVE